VYVLNEICDVSEVTKGKVGTNVVSVQNYELEYLFSLFLPFVHGNHDFWFHGQIFVATYYCLLGEHLIERSVPNHNHAKIAV
jgi:hypothetical protein